jgi:HD-GYP domain-containing protein (c-di-GMP phosphodiesterase class II)
MLWRTRNPFRILRWEMGVSMPIGQCKRGATAWGLTSMASGNLTLSVNGLPIDLLGNSAGLRVKELEEQQQALLKSVVCGFNQLLDLRDLSTGIHSTRLAEWAVRVARKLGIAETDFYQLEVAALLHDIGKIGIPDSILKKEGKLTDEERALMNKHPEYSWSILRLFAGLEKASLYALHHHESYNGAGYPAGLKGDEIPIGSRIVAVIDAYDAMISNRCYRRGLPHEEAVRRLTANAGTQFDPVVVQTFIEIAKEEVADVFAATGMSPSAVI